MPKESAEKTAFEIQLAQAIAVAQEKNRKYVFDSIVLLNGQARPDNTDFRVWLMKGGRGSGKTLPGAYYCTEHARRYGKEAIIHVIAPTSKNSKNVNIKGPSGLIGKFGDEWFWENKTDTILAHRGGARALFFSDEAPLRLDGPQCTFLWFDEAGICSPKTWTTANLGLRVRIKSDPNFSPWALVTTTPKNCEWLRELSSLESTYVTTLKTKDNYHLDPRSIEALYQQYGDSKLAKSELDGDFIEDVDGALFKSRWIRKIESIPTGSLKRIVVAVDPAVTSNADSDDTGICVAGIDFNGNYYILDCVGVNENPFAWANLVIEKFNQYNADCVIGETNQGGDLIKQNLENVMPTIKFKKIHAKKGKGFRAQPISTLYEQGRVFHVGHFPKLEEQMTTRDFSNPRDPVKDDCLDSMVYAISELSSGGEEITFAFDLPEYYPEYY